MPNANGCELVRVFTRRVGSPIADDTIKSNEAFQVVLQAEVGQALHNTGGAYNLSIVVKDETAGNIINNAAQAGNFKDVNWPNLDLEFAFPNIAAQGAAKQDHLYRVIAVLRAGAGDPIMDWAETYLLITPP